MNIIFLIAYAVIFLFIVAVIASLSIIALSEISHRKESKYQKINLILKNNILRYLDNKDDLLALKKVLPNDSEVLIGVIIQIAVGFDDRERSRLIDMLEDLGLEEMQVHQLRMLLSRNDAERLKAATVLPYIMQKDRIEEPLINSLKDKALEVRLAVARSLGVIKATRAIKSIIDNLALEGDWPITRVIEAINAMGPASVSPLITYLQSEETIPAARVIAIAVLGTQKDPASVPIILEHLSSDSLEVQIQCAKSLGLIGGQDVVAPLITLIKSSPWELRSASAIALGQIKDQLSIPELIHALSDATWWVRFNAANALYGMGQSGTNALLASLDGNDRFARDISKLVLDEKKVSQ